MTTNVVKGAVPGFEDGLPLNLPILDAVSACRNVLIVGMGGGFDIFCGLPLYFALRAQGHTVHLANLSFSHLETLKDSTWLSDSLVEVTADARSFLPYFPELHLARWFKEQRRGEDVPVWCFAKTGARPLIESYRVLVEHLHIDGLLLVDGGVDSLMRGDEEMAGTLIEDSLSLLAAQEMNHVPVRLLACLGLGAEQDVAHAAVFENMAALTEADAFWGSCSLTRRMGVYRAYEEAVLYVHEKCPHDPSVINASILSAARGNYGNFHLTEKTKGSRLWISPLMPLYWFFDLPAVAERNLILEQLRTTETFQDALRRTFEARQMLPIRPRVRMPLP